MNSNGASQYADTALAKGLDRETGGLGRGQQHACRLAARLGRILSQNPDGSSECGLWSCTPGSRKVTFAADEFCHFLSGRGTYVRENGEEIPVEAGMLVFFPAGWAGTSTITQTLTKAFMCR
ncbi:MULTISPECIES: cupin domain-containing protein [unclassified Mesorhizobium]|uniref:cupin domain-containing protein n=1 Tax=unclassified Mesorhizobium TaxID=325217 RepID=UPI00041886E5|nr:MULTISPECIES: cupin domain-containing protein [unclassified Mesorhizobium]WJI46489.1 cupin domain-containing protein [Mesorhizobium sp. C120A]WJI82912.1 cupin domain-containing protein [Mesorhizobium sp. C374B]WJI89434.1 cupin domain-containing protein [Mesorhizobium sp. C372A]